MRSRVRFNRKRLTNELRTKMRSRIRLNRKRLANESDSTKRIFDIIAAGLRRRGDVSTKAAALADDIRTEGAARRAENEANRFITRLCIVVVEIAHSLPPDHPWQDTFVQAMQNVQQTEEDVEQLDKVQKLAWKHLPELYMYIRKDWFDPTQLDYWTREEVSDWENLNSFFARFKTETFTRWRTFPIWQLREGLEEKLDKGPILNSRLWVATEWILHYGDIIFEYEASEEVLDESWARSLRGGSLCSGITPLSWERMAFWKKRLVEMLSEKEALGLSKKLVKRVVKAAEKIGEFERTHPH